VNMSELADKLGELTECLPEQDYPGILKAAANLVLSS